MLSGCSCARGPQLEKRCPRLNRRGPASSAVGGAGARCKLVLIRKRLVFIDENPDQDQHGAIARLGTERQAAARVRAAGDWRTQTFLGALRHDRLAARCVFDGQINGECFRAYVEQQLVPAFKPGDIVIMDNLGSHKSAAARRAIGAAGARLWYLPPCSPDLNPIEQAFTKIKHRVRQTSVRCSDDIVRSAHMTNPFNQHSSAR